MKPRYSALNDFDEPLTVSDASEVYRDLIEDSSLIKSGPACFVP